jgi:diguanylate cyclase (GGDEF)-like protein
VLLKSAFAGADHRNSPMTIALLDLDNFKRINDSYGHQIGDEVLRKVASRLIGAVRNNDVVCRIGGDEFMILMSDTDAPTAGHIAERIRRAVTDTPVPTRDGTLPMSVSVGYTVRLPKDDAPVDTLLERADQALLQAKSAGRNRVRMTS